MFWIGLAVLFLLLSPNSAADLAKFEGSAMDKRYTDGKAHMEKIESIMMMSKFPRHGECWKSVLRDLQTGCAMLTEEIQSKLAFAFTSCFSEMLGLPPYLCEASTPIKDCVRNLDSNGMATFRDYFLHTQDMCFYIQHEIWQEETDKAVNELTNVANSVTKNIQDTQTAQERILTSQQESLRVQSDLMKDNNALYNVVLKVKDVFDDFKHSADEHRLIFLEIFEKLSKMQTLVSWIQGEMSLLDTMGFYFACLVFGFFATATRRTRHARFYIILLFIGCLSAERAVCSHFAESEEPLAPEDILYYISYIRRASALLGIIILIVAAANYRDYQVMNTNMLHEMSSQMHDLLKFVEELQSKPFVTSAMNALPNRIKRTLSNDDDTLSVSSKSSRESSEGSSFSSYSNDSEDSEEDFDIQDLEVKQLGHKILGGIENVPQGNPLDSSTPNGIASGRYSLRARKSFTPNPVLKSERPSDFAKVVHMSHRMSMTLERSLLNYYSSDEDF